MGRSMISRQDRWAFRCEEMNGASGWVAVSMAPIGQLEVLKSIPGAHLVTEEPNAVLDFGGVLPLFELFI